jgi:hypothetical protein
MAQVMDPRLRGGDEDYFVGDLIRNSSFILANSCICRRYETFGNRLLRRDASNFENDSSAIFLGFCVGRFQIAFGN